MTEHPLPRLREKEQSVSQDTAKAEDPHHRREYPVHPANPREGKQELPSAEDPLKAL